MNIKDFKEKFKILYEKINFELNRIKEAYKKEYSNEYESYFYFEDDINIMLKEAFNLGYNMRGL